jgi:hypothetical protein
MRVLTDNVWVDGVFYRAGSTEEQVGEDVARIGPHVWRDLGGPPPVVAPEPVPPGDSPDGHGGAGAGADAPSDGDGQPDPPAPDAPAPPPTAGPGSSVDRWRHYAAEVGVHVDRHATRADIIQAVSAAGFPVE